MKTSTAPGPTLWALPWRSARINSPTSSSRVMGHQPTRSREDALAKPGIEGGLECLEAASEILRRLVAEFGIFLQGAMNDPCEVARQRRVDFGHRLRRVLDDRRDDRDAG